MKNLYKALAAFQYEVPSIHKNTKGYGYSYAPLSEIFEVIKPLLQKHDLGFTQIIEPEGLKTILFHTESGESISSVVPIPGSVTLKGMNEFQVLGSAITYVRRYAISAMLGLVTDVDSDGNGFDDKGKEATKPPPPTKPTPKKDTVSPADATNIKGYMDWLNDKLDHTNILHFDEITASLKSQKEVVAKPVWAKVKEAAKKAGFVWDVEAKKHKPI